MKLEELLGKRLVFVDGGMGTMLQAAGLTGGEAPERWNLTHPETVAEVHRAYLAAGCDIVTANTFGATGARFGAELQKVIQAGVKLARQGVEEAGHGFAAFDMGPTGKLLAPYGELPFQEAVSLYRQAAAWGAEAGADAMGPQVPRIWVLVWMRRNEDWPPRQVAVGLEGGEFVAQDDLVGIFVNRHEAAVEERVDVGA